MTTGCDDGKTIKIWVGNESATFYQEIANDYIANHPEFGFNVKVIGADTGSAAGVITQDPSAAGDIYTVAHDNIGKLVDSNCAKPIIDEELIAQVEANNTEAFKKVCKVKWNNENYLFGVPYISQALMLYYNTELVTEEQAKTLEGLQEAAAAASTGTKKVKGITFTGTDGYNFSWSLLARKADDNSSTLKIFEGGEKSNCYAQGDDMVSIVKYQQRLFKDENGAMWPTDSGWATEISNGSALSVVGGAWHFDAFKSAVGESKMGVTVLPTFTLTSEDATGSFAAGTTFQAGTFADCKVFMINGASKQKKYAACQELIKYFSSKDIQNLSFKECLNIPAYIVADEYINSIKDELTTSEYSCAVAQTKMAEYGIPQPFINGTLNTYYYSKNAPDYYKNMIINDKDSYGTERKIREGLYTMEHIWQKGKVPSSFPDTLPEDIQ